ncbi:MAG TPA: class I SAM-dependent methyltransferase [Flavobacteriales bacterium]|jgi:hypothetical protein|nr:class I SAM-dependent methyltransferase [Flavobacteriales bacterium]
MKSILQRLYRFTSPKFQTLFNEYPVEFKPRYGHGKAAHDRLYGIVNGERANYRELLNHSREFWPILQEIKAQGNESNPSKPAWNNGFLPGLDILGLYTILSVYKPKHYIEVGSGNSTKVAKLARENQGLDLEITSIDPHPRAEIDHLADHIIRHPFERIDAHQYTELNKGDILFIDNSHRILPNSDAMVFFLEILPNLKPGVIVHIHDIYIPYDYPQFMCDRFYSEQYGLSIAMIENPQRYKTILPNYFISEDEELSSLLLDFWKHPNLVDVERHGGSFWIVISS